MRAENLRVQTLMCGLPENAEYTGYSPLIIGCSRKTLSYEKGKRND